MARSAYRQDESYVDRASNGLDCYCETPLRYQHERIGLLGPHGSDSVERVIFSYQKWDAAERNETDPAYLLHADQTARLD